MSLVFILSYKLAETMAQTMFLSDFRKSFEIGSKYFEYIKNGGDFTYDDAQEIIKFTHSGFDVNMNNMITNRQYAFSFEDSKYMIWKNISDELVLKEMS